MVLDESTAADTTDTTDMSVCAFKVTFECASALRTLADVLANLLETVDIHVVKSADFEGIRVEAIDAKQVCLVVSQVQADVEMDCPHTVFCVNTKTFNTCVRHSQAHYSLSVESVVGSSSIRLMSFETLSNSSVTRFTLPTLVCEDEQSRFHDIEYKLFIDMETSELKSIVSMCLRLQGETLTFKVRQPKVEHDSNKRARSDRRHMVLTISSTGACQQEHTFYSYVEPHGDDCVVGKCDVVAATPNDEELETTYEESYGARVLGDFLRSIDRHTVTLRLKKEKPLILHHKFGAVDSHVCLVVAPQVTDEQ